MPPYPPDAQYTTEDIMKRDKNIDGKSHLTLGEIQVLNQTKNTNQKFIETMDIGEHSVPSLPFHMKASSCFKELEQN